MVKLKPHQTKVLEFMQSHRALLVYHSTGTGKTITALSAMSQFSNPIIIIGPKSSAKAFDDDAAKLGIDPNIITFYTFKKIKNLLLDDSFIFKDTSVIIDEAHNIRTENINNIHIYSALSVVNKLMLLTATPIINYPNDLAVLINLVKNEDVLPTEKDLFDYMYYDYNKSELMNVETLKKHLKNTLSYYRIIDDDNYPKKIIHHEKVVMDSEQITEYSKYVHQYIHKSSFGTNISELLNVNFDTLSARNKNAFLTATRQISNTTSDRTDTPKLNRIMEVIELGPFPVIVYSNFLHNGIYPIAKLLNDRGISNKMITGNVSEGKIMDIVNKYNSGGIKVLLISSAGSESLDLKNTRQIHIVEPHWNESRIVQVMGRAVRYKSHEKLKLSERKVNIYRWISCFPSSMMNMSADEYLANLSVKKRDLIEKVEEVVISASI